MPLNDEDTRYLERALALAERARGRTSPNPLVGAVIVRETPGGSEIVGEGHHVGPGRHHAEVAAINDALRRAGLPEYQAGVSAGAESARSVCAGTTMYVSLEPCCTYGRTPPCTDALITAGFTRVVVGAIEPSPQIDGRGIELLREAGMQVDIAGGRVNHLARRQNDGTRKTVVTGLPFVTYKYALTLDGRVATDAGDSRWISSEQSRELVHRWRAWSDAVVVGATTQRLDDPRLTARDVGCERQPLRVVVDRDLGLAQGSALVQTLAEGPVLVMCGPEVSEARRAEVASWGVGVAVVKAGPDGRLDPLEVARHLASREVQTVLLEGGPQLAGAWWEAGLIDKVAAFICPRVAPGLANRGALCAAGPAGMADSLALQEVEVVQVGPDVLVSGYRGDPF